MTACMCSACRCSVSPASSWSAWFAAISTDRTPLGPSCRHAEGGMADVAVAAVLPPIVRAHVDYNEAVVKKFIIAAIFWAVVAFLIGVYLATELAWPQFNLGLS